MELTAARSGSSNRARDGLLPTVTVQIDREDDGDEDIKLPLAPASLIGDSTTSASDVVDRDETK